jgi:hypothetical protein
MNYSFIHLKLYKTYPDIFEKPEKYLGPNYQTILNFWWVVDGLNYEQVRILEKIYNKTSYEIRSHIYRQINEHVKTEKYEFEEYIWNAVVGACEDKHDSLFNGFDLLMGWITLELMVMHELLDKGLYLLFVPMLEDL